MFLAFGTGRFFDLDYQFLNDTRASDLWAKWRRKNPKLWNADLAKQFRFRLVPSHLVADSFESNAALPQETVDKIAALSDKYIVAGDTTVGDVARAVGMIGSPVLLLHATFSVHVGPNLSLAPNVRPLTPNRTGARTTV